VFPITRLSTPCVLDLADLYNEEWQQIQPVVPKLKLGDGERGHPLKLDASWRSHAAHLHDSPHRWRLEATCIFQNKRLAKKARP